MSRNNFEIFEKAVTHKTMMRLKTWRMTNDGLNNLEYGVREIIKNRLFTKLMIESRLLVPQKISISDVDSGDSLIFIGKIIWFRLQKYNFDQKFRLWLHWAPKGRQLRNAEDRKCQNSIFDTRKSRFWSSPGWFMSRIRKVIFMSI